MQSMTGYKTFYGVHWWLSDNEDFNEENGFKTLQEARTRARNLEGLSKGYHDFTIYAYHAELVDDSFEEDGILYPRQKWQKVDDDYEKLWNIKGETI